MFTFVEETNDLFIHNYIYISIIQFIIFFLSILNIKISFIYIFVSFSNYLSIIIANNLLEDV